MWLFKTPSYCVPQKPTTGLLAITLALHLCDLVHIAGFGYPDAYNKKQTIHYYEQITLKSMAVSIPFGSPVSQVGWDDTNGGMLGEGEGQGHRVALDVVFQCQSWDSGIWTPQLASSTFAT